MRVSMIALAVAGVMAAGVAQAQSNVTVYGIVDTWVGSSRVGLNASSVTGMADGGLQGSRWGLRGTEDLGNGLAANFQLEQGFNSDSGNARRPGRTFDRQAWVGLSGGFGEVRLGNTWTAYDDVAYNSNSVFDSAFSPVYGDVGTGRLVFVSETFVNSQPGNVIKYITPELGGFSGSFTYSLDENGGGSETTAIGLSYSTGPFSAAFTYQDEEDKLGAGLDWDVWNLNASYDFGVAVVKGSYARTNDASDVFSAREWQIGVDVPLGSNVTLAAGYARSRDVLSTGDKRDGFAIGLGYTLSPRTTMYAGYSTADSEARATGATNGDFRLFAVGVRHTF